MTPSEDKVNDIIKEYGPLKVPEIAGLFKESEACIGNILHRAILKLRKRWKDEKN